MKRSYDEHLDSLPAADAHTIEKVCSEYQAAWQSGQSPQIEDFLSRADVHLRPALLLQLLKLELEYLRRSGKGPSREAYDRRFPDDPLLVSRAFDVDDTVSMRQAPSPASTSNGRLLAVGDRFGRFSIIQRLGAGGFGCVYKAHDHKLDRDVALKIPKLGKILDEHDEQRFLREARAAGQLQHPHIVAVYDAGTIDGTLFISSRFIDGETLAAAIRRGKPFSTRETAELARKLAEALHEAHNKEITHRDVKPANILLDAAGEPYLADFGLARREETDVLRTQEGAHMGTPAYMSPEQHGGHSHLADARSDLWSLGVVLYELLAGRRPFLGDITAIRQQVQQQDPIPPRKIRPGVPKDLETICLRCLEKDPRHRYPSCQHLADELRRWLDGYPITARSVTSAERVWRWCRRNQIVAALLGGVAVALLLGIIVSSYFAIDARRQANLAQSEQEKSQEKDAEAIRLLREKNAETQRRMREEELKQAKTAESHGRLVRRMVADGDRHAAEGDLLRALPWYLAALELDAGDPQREAPHRLRLATTLREAPQVVHMWRSEALIPPEYSPDGKLLAAADERGALRIYDTATGKPTTGSIPAFVVNSVQFSPDGKRLLTNGGNGSQVWEVATGECLTPPMGGICTQIHWNPRTGYFLSEGQQVLAAGMFGARLFDANTGKPVSDRFDAREDKTRERHHLGAQFALLSPDARQVLVSFPQDSPEIWDVSNARQVSTLQVKVDEFNEQAMPADNHLVSASYSPDSKSVAVVTSSGVISICNPETGELQKKFAAGGQAAPVFFSYSPDGTRLLYVSQLGKVVSWDTANYTEAPFGVRESSVRWVKFDRHGRRIVVGTQDGAAVWDFQTGERIAAPLAHGGPVFSATFDPTGKYVATVSHDRLTRIWRLPAENAIALADADMPRIVRAELCPHARYAVSVHDDQAARLWNARSGKAIGEPLAGDDITRAAFTSSGRHVVTGNQEKIVVRVWEASTGKPLSPLLNHKGIVRDAFDVSPDGRYLAISYTYSTDDLVQIVDVTSGQPVGQPIQQPGTVMSMQFNARSDRLAVALNCNSGEASTAHIWRIPSGEEATPPLPHAHIVMFAGYSPDGCYVVTGSDDAARVWDASSGKLVGEPFRDKFGVRYAVFDASCTKLATVGNVAAARVWDVSTGKPLTPLLDTTAIIGLDFSSDGTQLATINKAGAVRVWNAETGEPLTSPLLTEASSQFLRQVRFADEGQRLMSMGSLTGSLHYWNLTSDNRPLAELRRDVQRNSSHRVDETGGLSPLAIAELLPGSTVEGESRAMLGYVQTIHRQPVPPPGDLAGAIPKYERTEIGTVNRWWREFPLSISAAGVVVGSDTTSRGFRYVSGETDAESKRYAETIVKPSDINSSGSIVGDYRTKDQKWIVVASLELTPENGRRRIRPIDLSALSQYKITSANGINDRGQITGTIKSDDSTAAPAFYAYLYEQGKFKTLPPLIEEGGSSGRAINNHGHVAGFSLVQVEPRQSRAVIWRDDKALDLGVLESGWISEALDINDRGQIVGYSGTQPDYHLIYQRAFLYDGGEMKDLGTLGGHASRAMAINNNGLIVGWAKTIYGRKHAFLYIAGKMVDIHPAGLNQSVATDINDSGEIVGYMIDDENNYRGFILTPQ